MLLFWGNNQQDQEYYHQQPHMLPDNQIAIRSFMIMENYVKIEKNWAKVNSKSKPQPDYHNFHFFSSVSLMI